MIMWLLLMLSSSPATSQDKFALRCDTQAWYDEAAQMALLSRTPGDIDTMHSVFDADDVSFVDADGHHHDWTEMRASAVLALQGPPADQMRQVLRDVKPTADGATAVIVSVTVRKVIDTEGRYGRAGASHAVAIMITYRDSLVQNGTSWKLKTREQVGAPETLVDKLPKELEGSRCGS